MRHHVTVRSRALWHAQWHMARHPVERYTLSHHGHIVHCHNGGLRGLIIAARSSSERKRQVRWDVTCSICEFGEVACSVRTEHRRVVTLWLAGQELWQACSAI